MSSVWVINYVFALLMHCHVGYLKQDLIAQSGLVFVISPISTGLFLFLFFQSFGLTLALFKVLTLTLNASFCLW